MSLTEHWRPRPTVVAAPAYRPGRAADGRPDPLALASNELPFSPLPSVRQAISDAAAVAHRYPDPRASALRAALARYCGVDHERVAIGAGSIALLYELVHAVTAPSGLSGDDDTVLIPWPSFEGYPIAIALSGARETRVPLTDHRIDVDRLAGAIETHTRLVVIAEPNNPTGTSIGAEALVTLCEATADRCLLVIDEAYHDFRTGPVIDAVALAERFPHVVVLRTFSKAHGLAGLRVGYAVADPEVVELVNKVAPPFSVSAVAQAAAIASLHATDELRERVAMVVDERSRLRAGLIKRGWDVADSHANFVWLPLHESGWPATALADALARCGVLVRPLDGGVRITIGEPGTASRVLAALDAVVFDGLGGARRRSTR